MGKVFTPEEIREGAVPVEGAHLAAADIIVDQILHREAFAGSDVLLAIGHVGIRAGLIHGSVTHGTENVRSDLDVLLIHVPNTDTATGLDIVRDVFETIETNLHVPIEANIVTQWDARHRNHRIDPLFYRYLYRAEDNPHFSNCYPTRYLSTGFHDGHFTPSSLLRVVERYTANKTASFASGLTERAPADTHRYQRALELPKNLGRKVLSMQEPGRASAINPGIMAGEDIIEGFKEFVDAQRGQDYFDVIGNIDRLDAIDREYSELLDDTLDAKTSVKSYAVWLENHRIPVLELAHAICVGTQERLRTYGRELQPKPVKTQDEQLVLDIALDVDDFDGDY